MWLCIKYEIPETVKRGKGAIVNNDSVTGLIGAPGAVANVSSKHGVTGLDQISCSAIRYAGNPSQRSGPRECAHSNIHAIHSGPSDC
jgi:NAD(P)-dependent dehydrogenase (short-subunit alcohol dehydrogenase family)